MIKKQKVKKKNSLGCKICITVYFENAPSFFPNFVKVKTTVWTISALNDFNSLSLDFDKIPKM